MAYTHTHLRSTSRPELVESFNGGYVVHTECGLLIRPWFVDNEHADCPECLRVDASFCSPSTGLIPSVLHVGPCWCGTGLDVVVLDPDVVSDETDGPVGTSVCIPASPVDLVESLALTLATHPR